MKPQYPNILWHVCLLARAVKISTKSNIYTKVNRYKTHIKIFLCVHHNFHTDGRISRFDMATIQLFKTQIPFSSTNQQNCNILTKIHLKSSEVTSNTCFDIITPSYKQNFFFNSINDLWLYENWPRKTTYIKAGQIQRIAPILTSSCSIDIASPIFIHKIH